MATPRDEVVARFRRQAVLARTRRGLTARRADSLGPGAAS